MQSTTSGLIQDTNAHRAFHPEIYVSGELVQIPYRTGYEWPCLDDTHTLSPSQLVVLAAWTSRHHDGRVRQKALRQLLESDAQWTIPFVIQLCGDYVIEIGQDVLEFITSTLPQHPQLQAAYVQFIRDNPRFLEITVQRAVSYWNDDYRRWIRRESYPQLAALDALAAITPVVVAPTKLLPTNCRRRSMRRPQRFTMLNQ